MSGLFRVYSKRVPVQLRPSQVTLTFYYIHDFLWILSTGFSDYPERRNVTTTPRCVGFLAQLCQGLSVCPEDPAAFSTPAFSTLSTGSGCGFLCIQSLEAKDGRFMKVFLSCLCPNWESLAFICSNIISWASLFISSNSLALIL